MSEHAEREMTLREWVGRLGPQHFAHREYTALLDEVESLRSRTCVSCEMAKETECVQRAEIKRLEADLAAADKRIRQLSEHHAFTVVDPVGGPVAAPCAIEGCRYDALEADLAAARAVLDTAIEHTDEFGAVTVRVEPLAYEAWQERKT